MKYNVFIRCSGNHLKGLGHIMRCIALATELKTLNASIIFLIDNDIASINLVRKYNFKFIPIKSNTLSLEIYEVIKITSKYNSPIFITDSYWIDEHYLIELKKHCLYLISIDDNNLLNYPSDMVINPNIHATDLNYSFSNNTKYLLGCKYCLLRNEFIVNNPIDIKKIARSVLITMGGTDVNNFTSVIIESILSIPNITLNVVVNSNFSNLDSLYNLYENVSNINLILNPLNMRDIIIQNDLSISAGGSTSYELASVGMPSILIPQVDNQLLLCEKFHDLKIAINAGWFDKLSKHTIYTLVNNLISDYTKRTKLHDNMLKVIDINGCKNIVEEVLKEVRI